METQLTVKNVRHQAWVGMVQQQTRSGLSVREWCEQNQLSTKTFYYRRKLIREELLNTSFPTFTEFLPTGGSEELAASTFVPDLTVSVKDTVIGVNRHTPADLLAQVIGVARNA